MRFPLSKSCRMALKLHRHVFHSIHYNNNYQAYQKVKFLYFQHTQTWKKLWIVLERKIQSFTMSSNSVICDKGWTEIWASNIGLAWSNPQILSVFPQSIALNPHFSFLNPPFSILLPQIFFIQPQFSLFNSSSSSTLKSTGYLAQKSPQNSMISNKMFASATCSACSFFQIWTHHPTSCVTS